MISQNAEISVLFQDEWLVAVHKPAGLLVHRTDLDRHATVSALQLVRNRIGRHVYPVHRLDRPTSGVLIFALSPDVAQVVAAEFSGRSVTKTYLAVVRGCMPDEGVIDHSLAEQPDRMPGKPALPVREAVTAYRRLAQVELPVAVGRYATSRYSLVQVTPHTGRRHQIRRHLKHLMHPIVGDTRYGEGRHNRFFRDEFGCSRMLLAAVELSLSHPSTGENLTITAPVEDDFRSALRKVGWENEVPVRWLQ